MHAKDNHRVIVNANVITMDAAERRCRALAIESGRVRAVGAPEEMQLFIDQGWPVEDFHGRTLLPGFIDTHEHLMLTGSQAAAVHLDAVANIGDILARIAARAAETEPGQWVRGSYLNEQALAEKRMPDRRELDRAVPHHPVLIMHATCHMCSLNTRALDILALPPDLEGLDRENGDATGVVRDPGILTHLHPAIARRVPLEAKIGFLQQAAEMALAQGITTVHALDGGDLGPGDTRVIWQHRDRLPVRVVCYNQSMDLGEVAELDLPRVGGCICSDGAFEAHTAALFEPYADQPDNYGTLTFSQEV
ncbi:MAG: amidohydrolase family protein, partial [Desulfobacteraceae bacterium]|nr:amidohydrolase family protein [Desulfobacteraceae bacterium]